MPLMKTLRSRHCDGALGKAGTFLRDARVQRLACFWDHARHMPATDSECARRTSPWSYTVHRCSLPICARASRPGRDALTGVDFLASPCVPSPVSAIRTPHLFLLPLWEKGVGGMRGKSARERKTLSTLFALVSFQFLGMRAQAHGNSEYC